MRLLALSLMVLATGLIANSGYSQTDEVHSIRLLVEGLRAARIECGRSEEYAESFFQEEKGLVRQAQSLREAWDIAMTPLMIGHELLDGIEREGGETRVDLEKERAYLNCMVDWMNDWS